MMTRILTKCAILLGGLYATGLALWHLGSTVVFVCQAERVPGIVVDVKERPFDGVVEMMQHGNMPWEGPTAYQPYVRYELYGRPVLDDTLPDLDNRNYTNGQAVEIILHPQQPHRRHLYSAKFLWVGDLLLLALGVLLLLLARRLLRRRKKTQASKPAAKPKQAPAPTPAPEPVPAPPPAATAAAPETLKLEAEPAPRKRRRKAASSGTAKSAASKSSTGAKTTTRSRKKTDSADKPKTTRRRKKTQEAS